MVEEIETPARSIDQLVTVEMRVKGLPSGVIWKMNEAATEAEGEIPILSAAKALWKTVDEGDTVIITTGAGGPPWLPHGETDGPQGAIGLAHGLAVASGAKPVLVTEERSTEPLKAAARACGLNTLPYDQLSKRSKAVSVISYTEDDDEAEEAAEKIYDKYDPSALIAVEKMGPNKHEVYHSLTGHDITEDHAKMGPLFDMSSKYDVLTVGVGDGGNEIGLGKIEEEIRDIQPYGDECVCPCEGGVATRIAADHVVIGGTSNWGAYGVEALLALLGENTDAMHSPDDEIRMLEFSVMEGSNDGLYGRPLMLVDGTSKETQRGIISMINNTIENHLTEVHREF